MLVHLVQGDCKGSLLWLVFLMRVMWLRKHLLGFDQGRGFLVLQGFLGKFLT